MQSNSDPYSGGIFQYIPFNGTEWIPGLLCSGLAATRIQIMLSVCSLLAVGLLIVFIFYISKAIICSKSRLTRRRLHRPADKKLAGSSDSDLSLESESRSFETLLELDKFSQQWNFEAELNNLVQPNHQIVSVEHNTEMTEAVSKLTNSHQTVSKCHFQGTSISLERDHSTDSSTLSDMSRSRLVFLSIIVSFFVICMLVHVTSLIVAIHTDYLISEGLVALPGNVHGLLAQVLEFARFSLDSAYSVMLVHIRNDAARPDGQSRLRSLVEKAKSTGSQALACLIKPCLRHTNSTDNSLSEHILLFPSGVNQQVELHDMKLLADSLLTTFEQLVWRMKSLFEAAVTLNSQTIQTTERAWYEYRQGLSQLAPFQPVWMQQSEANSSWKSSVLLTKVHEVICENLSRSLPFRSCEEVSLYLHSFVTHANGLPAMLPPKTLESVIQFASMPRALHAEQVVNDWLPVITDLPGQGVLFLLEKYLIPEMNRLKHRLSTILTTVPTPDGIGQYTRYTRYFSSAMILIFTSLLVSSLSLLAATCFGLFHIYIKFRDWSTESKSRVDSEGTLTLNLTTEKPNCIRACSRRCSSLRWIVWLMAMAVCFLSAVIATSLVYSSTLVQTQMCLYMFHGLPQDKADRLLTDGLFIFLRNLEFLKPLLATPNLSFIVPRSILRTLDTDYRPGQISLLSSLHWNRPVNFTTLLHSSWFNQILHSQWDKDVRAKLNQMDLAEHLPKIELEQVFDQVVQSMQLQRSFDNLPVLPLDQYLNPPGPAYVVELQRILVHVDTKASQQLATVFENVTKAYETYKNGYETAAESLTKIKNNRQIIEPMRLLVSNGSIALKRLNKLNNSELVSMIDQIINDGFPQFLPYVDKQLVPFLLPLLDDLIPYPGLQLLYRRAISLACPVIDSNSLSNSSSYIQNSVSLNPELDTFGSSLFASAVTLWLAGLFSLFIR